MISANNIATFYFDSTSSLFNSQRIKKTNGCNLIKEFDGYNPLGAFIRWKKFALFVNNSSSNNSAWLKSHFFPKTVE